MALGDGIEHVQQPDQKLAEAQEADTYTGLTAAELRKAVFDNERVPDRIPPPITDIDWEGLPGDGQLKSLLEDKKRTAEYADNPLQLILKEREADGRPRTIRTHAIPVNTLEDAFDEASLTGIYFMKSTLLRDKETTAYTIKITKKSAGYALRFSLDVEQTKKAPEQLEKTDTFAWMLNDRGELVKDALVWQAGVGKETGKLYIFTNPTDGSSASGEGIYTEYLQINYQRFIELQTAGGQVVLPQNIRREGKTYQVVLKNNNGKLIVELQQINRGLTAFATDIQTTSPEKIPGSDRRAGRYYETTQMFVLYADSSRKKQIGSVKVSPSDWNRLEFDTSVLLTSFVPLGESRAVQVKIRNDSGMGVFVLDILDRKTAGFDPIIKEVGDIPGKRTVGTTDTEQFIKDGNLNIQVVDDLGTVRQHKVTFTNKAELDGLQYPGRSTSWLAFSFEGGSYEIVVERNTHGMLVVKLRMLQTPSSPTALASDPAIVSLPYRELNSQYPQFSLGDQKYPVSFYTSSVSYQGSSPLNPVQQEALKRLTLSDKEDIVSSDAFTNDKQVFAYRTKENMIDTKRFEFSLDQLIYLSSKDITVLGRGATGKERLRTSAEHTFSLTKNDKNDEPRTILVTFAPQFDQQGNPQNRKMSTSLQLVGNKFGVKEPGPIDRIQDAITGVGEKLSDRYTDFTLLVLNKKTISKEEAPLLRSVDGSGIETAINIIKYDGAVFPMVGVSQEEAKPFFIERDNKTRQFVLKRKKEGFWGGKVDIDRINISKMKDGDVVGIDGFGGDGLLQVVYNEEQATLQFFIKPPCELTKTGCNPETPIVNERVRLGFAWPVAGKQVTNKDQLFLAHRNGHLHKGIDIVAGNGTPFTSVLDDGIVKRADAGRKDKNGNQLSSYLVVEHQLSNGKKYRIKYIHGKNYKVKVGDLVKKGMKLGEVSDVGSPGAYHLHLEILEHDPDDKEPYYKYEDPNYPGRKYINPAEFFDPTVSGIKAGVVDPRYPEPEDQERIVDISKYPVMAADVNIFYRGAKGKYAKYQEDYKNNRREGIKRGIYPAGYTKDQFHKDLQTAEGLAIPTFDHISPATNLSGEARNTYIKTQIIPKLYPFLKPLCEKYNMRPSVLIAQICLESQGGTAIHTAKDNNYASMKPSSSRVGPVITLKTHEEIRGKKEPREEKFKAFVSSGHSVIDLIWRHQRMNVKLGGDVSLRNATNNVSESGYATDGSYADKLTSIIQNLDLDKYDKQIFNEKEVAEVEKREEVLSEEAGVQKNIDGTINLGLDRSIKKYELSSYHNSFVSLSIQGVNMVSSLTTGKRRIGQEGGKLLIYTRSTEKPIAIKLDNYVKKEGSNNILLLDSDKAGIIINGKKYGLVVRLEADGTKRKASFALSTSGN